MVNAHGKYPGGATNSANYQADGSDVRDATAEEKVRYLNANKHKLKTAVETVSSDDRSRSSARVVPEPMTKERHIAVRGERGGGDMSSSERDSRDSKKNKHRDDSRGGSERDSSRGHESRGSGHCRDAATVGPEPDEDEADRREMAEIQGRIEAWKAAKDLETAHATIKELKTSGKSASISTDKHSKRGPEKVKKGEQKTGASRGAKKITANQTATDVAVKGPQNLYTDAGHPVRPEAETANEPVQVESKRGRANKRATVERRGDDVLATLKFCAIAYPRARTQEDAEEAAKAKLVIAFVATALGKKIPRVASGQIISGMTECHVEHEAPRKRSKTPILTAPPNSVESADPGSDVRFSQSDVIIGYPADVEETGADVGAANLMPSPAGCPETRTTGAVLTTAVFGVGAGARSDTPTTNLGGVASFSCAIPEVPAHEGFDEAPAAPSEVPTPMIGMTIVREIASDVQGPVQTPKSTEIVPGSVEDDIARKIRYDHRQKLIREIAASQLLQEELAKNNPNLVMAASFLSQVSGTDAGYRKLKETAGARIKKGLEDAEAGSRSDGGDWDISIATNTGDLTDTDNAAIVPVAIVHEETAELQTAELPNAIDQLNPEGDAIDQLSPEGDATDAVSVADSVMSVGSSSSDRDQSHLLSVRAATGNALPRSRLSANAETARDASSPDV